MSKMIVFLLRLPGDDKPVPSHPSALARARAKWGGGKEGEWGGRKQPQIIFGMTNQIGDIHGSIR